MEIIELPIKSIFPYKNNPRHNDKAVEFVANSLRQFGWKQPIVIDEKYEIVAGHTRWKAAKMLGMETVPCVMADDLTPEQVQAYRLADNKTAEMADWDFDLLEQELNDIDPAMFDMADFGFFQDISTGESAQDDSEVELVEDEVPESENVEHRCKLGQIWLLGNHRLMCGDSTVNADVQRLMAGDIADLCVTDPPYNVNYGDKSKMLDEYLGGSRNNNHIMNDNMSDSDFYDFLFKAFGNLADVLKPGGAFYVWYASVEVVNFVTALRAHGLQVRQELIWNKNSLVLGRQDYQWKHEPCCYGWKLGAGHYFTDTRTNTTVMDFEKPKANKEHPTMKPIPLIGHLIQNSSKKGELVLDLFGGSGTTLIASEQLGRICYMMEFDPKFADVIIKRWEDLTGQKAVLSEE